MDLDMLERVEKDLKEAIANTERRILKWVAGLVISMLAILVTTLGAFYSASLDQAKEIQENGRAIASIQAWRDSHAEWEGAQDARITSMKQDFGERLTEIRDAITDLRKTVLQVLSSNGAQYQRGKGNE